MPSLKDLKNRIKSVKSTQKITKAMKMVAAAKLRRATERAEASRPYASQMEAMLSNLAGNMQESGSAPLLLAGTGKEDKHLLVVLTSDRGLCGGFNSSITRAVKQKIVALQAEGKEVKLICVGRKSYDQLAPLFKNLIIEFIPDITKKPLSYAVGQEIATKMLVHFEKDGFDVCTLVFNTFRSAIAQIVTFQQLIPLKFDKKDEASQTAYEYEPGEEALLLELLPRNISVQTFKALLENSASEQGARMTAMDNASRNAGDMINKLSLKYNRTRQAVITKELIEIISGAEAV